MKKAILMALAAALSMTACENPVVEDSLESNESETTQNETNSKKFTFTVKGDFGAAVFTRGYLQADGKDMTDLWVLDYMDGQCVQALHQTPEDATWGSPKMSLAYGQHHVYFVASRGVDPSINETDHIISWGTVRDTFWKDYEVNVVATSNGNRAVTLDRVATKLKVTVNDEVPENCKRLEVTPSVWFYGLDYKTGDAVSSRNQSIGVDIPESMTGTTGQLIMSVFGISGTDEWTTNVSIDARDGDGAAIGHAVITGAPFKRNRATEYSGSLFTAGGSLDVNVNGDWDVATTGTW